MCVCSICGLVVCKNKVAYCALCARRLSFYGSSLTHMGFGVFGMQIIASLQQSVKIQMSGCNRLGPLVGPVEHLTSKRSLPTVTQDVAHATQYSIEMLSLCWVVYSLRESMEGIPQLPFLNICCVQLQPLVLVNVSSTDRTHWWCFQWDVSVMTISSKRII